MLFIEYDVVGECHGKLCTRNEWARPIVRPIYTGKTYEEKAYKYVIGLCL